MSDFNKKLKVAVLMGGIGSEREVSLQSGQSVANALKVAGFDVVAADVAPERLEVLDDKSIDVFFPALHGQFGEDGWLQQIFEDKSLVYAGSGPQSSRLAIDKMTSKKLFVQAGIPAPEGIEFDSKINAEQIASRLGNSNGRYVVKPVRQGSSVGVSIVDDAQHAEQTARQTLETYGDCMLEEFIAGREITVGILGDKTLPIVEIQPVEDFYNYQAKYIDDKTQYLFDTITDSNLAENISRSAMDCFNALGCRGFARVDFILSQQGTAYALEVNTIPGFTDHSLLPKAAAKAGITMGELCKMIVEAAYLSPVVKNDR